MNKRIGYDNLRALRDTLNRVTKNPMDYFDDNANPAIGHYSISRAYGGYSLCRTVNSNGGESNVLSIGHIPARELYNLMHAYLRGIQSTRD